MNKIKVTMYVCSALLTLKIIACSNRIRQNYSYHPGYYHFSKKNNAELARQDSSVIYGLIKDAVSKEPLEYAVIKLNNYNKVQCNKNGSFNFKVPIVTEKIYLSANYIGYRRVETYRFQPSIGDSIRIDFYLYLDDRPIVD